MTGATFPLPIALMPSSLRPKKKNPPILSLFKLINSLILQYEFRCPFLSSQMPAFPIIQGGSVEWKGGGKKNLAQLTIIASRAQKT